ncbi:hypothetical protein [Ktedonobacter racemifer]|uniref:Uncharacterized protein n=1 Tax=Ktedonobacter racemifer DSM 44963 TaxID=485913 RepID=D6TMQ5_KTERA|nr:hypothetical protein [Ktedonobacter racemifer]EFH87055.1 hypothetical protein Krac_8376 [Ktedonobacter racemifer DSM 44963]
MCELAYDKQAHEEWKRIQEKLDRIHEKCAVWREKLSDFNHEFSYEEKREAVSFLGIKAIVWKKGHNPNFEIQCNPPNVASLL